MKNKQLKRRSILDRRLSCGRRAVRAEKPSLTVAGPRLRSLRGLTGGDGLGALHRDTLAAEPPRTVDGPWGTPNGTVLHTVLRVERWRTATERVSSIHEMRREAVVLEP